MLFKHYGRGGFSWKEKNPNKNPQKVWSSNWTDQLVIKTASEIWRTSISLLHQDSMSAVCVFPHHAGGVGELLKQISCALKSFLPVVPSQIPAVPFQLKSMLLLLGDSSSSQNTPHVLPCSAGRFADADFHSASLESVWSGWGCCRLQRNWLFVLALSRSYTATGKKDFLVRVTMSFPPVPSHSKMQT